MRAGDRPRWRRGVALLSLLALAACLVPVAVALRDRGWTVAANVA
ncbi:hypothetical protein ACSNOI_36140 [Actinomadura kijaniata]